MSFNFKWPGAARQSGSACNCGCLIGCPNCNSGTTPASISGIQVTLGGFASIATSGQCLECENLNAAFLLSSEPSVDRCKWSIVLSSLVCAERFQLWAFIETVTIAGSPVAGITVQLHWDRVAAVILEWSTAETFPIDCSMIDTDLPRVLTGTSVDSGPFVYSTDPTAFPFCRDNNSSTPWTCHIKAVA